MSGRRPLSPLPSPFTLSVILPVFNERGTVRTVLDAVLAKRIPGVTLEIIVIESRSTDGTREIVREYAGRPGLTVLWEDRPQGKGHAVRTGLARATGAVILIQDADLEYSLDDYEPLLAPLRDGRAAFVLGSRHGAGLGRIRQFSGEPGLALVLNLAHWAFTLLINLSLGLRLHDPFTMYKVFRRECLDGLTFECDRFDFDWELLIKLVRKGHRPLEIPVSYRSRSFREGKKIRFWRDPLTWLRAWAKARFGPLS